MLPIRKLGAIYINLWTGSRIQKPEVLFKMPEIVRNVVKFTVIRKMRYKNVADKPEVVVYFGLFWSFSHPAPPSESSYGGLGVLCCMGKIEMAKELHVVVLSLINECCRCTSGPASRVD